MLPTSVIVCGTVLVGNVLLFTLLRCGFFYRFRPAGLTLASSSVRRALRVGLRFDLRLAAVISLSLWALAWVPGSLEPDGGPVHGLWLAVLLIVEALVLVLYLLDFGTYSYLSTRLNASLTTFLSDLGISARMIWQSYPVVLLALVLVAWTVGMGVGLRALLTEDPVGGAAGWLVPVGHVGFALLLVGSIYGSLGWYPLRWSDAFFVRDRFVCHLALNPVLFLLESFKERARRPDPGAYRETYPTLATQFGVDSPDLESLNLRRQRHPEGRVAAETNVVVVLLETFAWFKAMGALDACPRFGELSEQGWLFDRFYVPMENTSRSLFAALFGIPDVNVHHSSSRNPLVVRQQTILNSFTDHRKLYFLGGSASWGNIRGMLSHNVEGLRIFEQRDYDLPRHDVWGISDADLFMVAHRELGKRSDRPFFAIVQTAGNHRPFRIPKDSRGFEPVAVDREVLKRHGFYSQDEFSGLRFLDHCLGYFIDLARQEDWFDNTVFVVFGDHGTTAGALDRRFGGLALASYHVPMVVYAPSLLGSSRTVSKVMSELDLMPTLAGLLGKPYVNESLGRDVFEATEVPANAFTFTAFENPPSVGLIEDDVYLNLAPDESASLFSLTPGPDSEVDQSREHPERTKRMADLARAMHQAARQLVYAGNRK